MIVGDRDEALQVFDFAMLDAHRRGSLFAVTGMYLWRGFTLFWRGDLIDAEEELRASFDQAEAWGYGPDTLQWNAAHLSWCLTERGDLAGARQALMRAPGARRRIRRRALLVQRPPGAARRRGPLRGRGRGRGGVRTALRPLPQPAGGPLELAASGRARRARA